MRLDQKERVNRLVIYFFYDADGIVDRYVPYMLEDVSRNCTELFVVCNGKLTPEGRVTFQKFTPNVLVRENVGFDVWAYKEALEHYGWDKLVEYDEVVMMNSTIMGPIYPFSEMFEEMNSRDVDFWGITKHHKFDGDPFGIKYGYIPEHIQSHFIAVRNSMLKSIEFAKYWKDIPPINSYDEAIGKHEAIFTKTFGDIGFVWGVYCDTSDMEKFTIYPMMMAPTVLLKKYKCPIFKRRSFFHDYHNLLNNSFAVQGKELMDYLDAQTDYDVDMIWENILRTCNLADMKNAMSLSYVLPEESFQQVPQKAKIALVLHSYFEDLVDYCYQYSCSMPDSADIYITTDKASKAQKIEDTFNRGTWKQVKVITIENRGRDVSSLLVGVAKYINQYDYVCFMHDKKVTQLDLGIKGHDFSERCFRNLLGTKGLVANILNLFDRNPRLGLLCPPPPNHADYYPTLGVEWGPNFQITKKLYDKLELHVPIAESKEPISPLGTMFWFRTGALKKLIDFGWKFDDFPEEPNNNDGTMLHGIERLYPFVAQDAGFYTAWITTTDYMRTEWTNLSFMLRNLNVQAFAIYGCNSHWGLVWTMGYYRTNQLAKTPTKIRFKRKIKAITPKPIWSALRKIYHFFGGKKWVG